MKGKKVYKVILIFFLVLLLLFIIHFVRNYIIISKIATKQDEISKSTNYSYTMNFSNLKTGETSVMDFYCKDNRSITIMGDYLFWYDEDTGEQIVINTVELSANVFENDDTPVKAYLPILDVSNNFGDKIKQALFSFITYDTVEDEKCYVINTIIGVKSTIPYISVENGTLLKLITGKVENSDEYSVIEYTNWKINEVTDEIVERPDLTTYEVIYN